MMYNCFTHTIFWLLRFFQWFKMLALSLLHNWIADFLSCRRVLEPYNRSVFFYTSLKWTSITFRKNGSADRFIMLSGRPVPPFHPPTHLSIFGWKEEQDELQYKLRPCNILYLISMCYESYQIFIGMLGDLFLALCNTWQLPLPLSLSHLNPLRCNISIHILHTVLCTLTNVLTRRIWLTIKRFFS